MKHNFALLTNNNIVIEFIRQISMYMRQIVKYPSICCIPSVITKQLLSNEFSRIH